MKAERIGAAILLLLLLACAPVRAQVATQEGIVLNESRVKTNVYMIKVLDLTTSAQAEQIDQLMESKEAILSSRTELATRTVIVEVLKALPPKNLRDIVEATGLTVAKSFEQ